MFLRIFPSIMLPLFLAILDQTIVASALTSIGTSLGSPERASWVVVGYLVAATIAAPVSGTLGDVYGRRRVLLLALSLFLAASIACAVAVSLEMLVIARMIQGLGGGALATSAHAFIGETVPPRERGRYQGYLATIVVTASAAGPVIGGLLTAHFGWRSVFAGPVPLILVAMLLARRLPVAVGGTRRWRLDVKGLVLFVIAVCAFLVMLDRVRSQPGAWDAVTLVLFALAGAALVALLVVERREPDPLVPLRLLRIPAIWMSCTIAFCHGASLISLVSLLPSYLHLVYGFSIERSSLMLLPLTVTIGVGSFLAGRLVTRTGHTALLPSVALTAVAPLLLVLALLAGSIEWTLLIVLLAGVGLGLGPTMAVVQLTVQVATGASGLGVAAGFVQFSRSIGGALGVAITSTALFATIGGTTEELTAPMNGLDAAAATTIAGFRAAFIAIAGFVAAGAALCWMVPLRRV